MRAWSAVCVQGVCCCVLALLLIAHFPPSQCDPQVQQYVLPGAVNPHFPLPWHAPLRIYAVPLWGPLGYTFASYSSLIGSPASQLPSSQTNRPFFNIYRQVKPLQDFGEAFHGRPGAEMNFMSLGGPQPAPRCGVSSFARFAADEKRTQQRLQFRQNAEEGEKGSVLLSSEEFEGPDLTHTVFEKYKGLKLIISTKITYGIITHSQEAPWQVAMFVNGKFHCGASLISDRHVLTASHCVSAYKNQPDLLELSIGDWDLASEVDGKNVKASVKKVTPHPHFNYFELQNDIAVLELTNPVKFTDKIMPVCLPPADLNVEGAQVTVTGWGRNEKNRLQTKLHKLTAVVIKNQLCSKRWAETGAPPSIIGQGIMCMDAQYGDSCKGDSGGPAITEHPTGSGIMVQAGIVSFGSASCTDASLPGVYTNVAKYRDWIIKQTKQ